MPPPGQGNKAPTPAALDPFTGVTCSTPWLTTGVPGHCLSRNAAAPLKENFCFDDEKAPGSANWRLIDDEWRREQRLRRRLSCRSALLEWLKDASSAAACHRRQRIIARLHAEPPAEQNFQLLQRLSTQPTAALAAPTAVSRLRNAGTCPAFCRGVQLRRLQMAATGAFFPSPSPQTPTRHEENAPPPFRHLPLPSWPKPHH